MKKQKLLLLLVVLGLTGLVFAKYTLNPERIATVTMAATWTGVQTVPDSALISADLARTLTNDDDAADIIDRRSATISFDGLRVDRTVQISGGPNLTYRQVTLYYIKMVADARANPVP
jgi:hypothetical protein